MSRYRAEGAHVYQGEKRIIVCEDGDQGQPAAKIAERTAALLEADFIRFCRAVGEAAASRTHGVVLGQAVDPAELPVEGC